MSLTREQIFRLGILAVNSGATIRAGGHIANAYALGGWPYAIVTAGTPTAYLAFFVAFALVMRRYERKALFATALSVVCTLLV